jgi:hypothetical protein
MIMYVYIKITYGIKNTLVLFEVKTSVWQL